MILYLMRHGPAEDQRDGDDASRRLTATGREKVKAAAAGMRALKLRFDTILTSALPRAVETAEIVSAAYGGHPAPEAVAAFNAGAAPADSIAALRSYSNREHVLAVGHEPTWSGVAATLMAGAPGAFAFDLKKSGLIVLELKGRFDKGGGRLLYMLAPRHLRRMRG